MDDDKWRADAAQDKVGLFQWVDPDFIGPFDQKRIRRSLKDLMATRHFYTEPPVSGPSSIYHYEAMQHDPGLLLEWVDYFYSPGRAILLI